MTEVKKRRQGPNLRHVREETTLPMDVKAAGRFARIDPAVRVFVAESTKKKCGRRVRLRKSSGEG